MKLTIKETREVEPKYLQAECGVRYWEDAEVNGLEDAEGDLIPCREGKMWSPLIDLETGTITNWKQGVTAKIHYKVCDAGVYTLLDADKNVLKEIDGYVPRMMCPKDSGYGDYVIMDVDTNGVIDKFRIDFDKFEEDED